MLDVDHFKKFNDSYGHESGDQALKLVAIAAVTILPAVEKAYRYGGEEFAIVFPKQGVRRGLCLSRPHAGG